MNVALPSEIPWGEIVAISLVAFVLVKSLSRSGWLNVVLIPVLGPLALGKFLLFSLLGRTRPYWKLLHESEEISNLFLFRARLPGKTGADPAGTEELRVELTELLDRWNKDHRWLEGPLQLVLRGPEVFGFCRLFTLPKALGLGADRRVYRDIERAVGFLEESSRLLGLEWTVINSVGVSGKVKEGQADEKLSESIQVLRGTIFWRPGSSASSGREGR